MTEQKDREPPQPSFVSLATHRVLFFALRRVKRGSHGDGGNRIDVSPSSLGWCSIKFPLLMLHMSPVCAARGQVIGDEMSWVAQVSCFQNILIFSWICPCHCEISWSLSIGQHCEWSCLPHADITADVCQSHRITILNLLDDSDCNRWPNNCGRQQSWAYMRY